MSCDTSEFDQPCPHGGSVVTCPKCLNEFMTAERLVEEATSDIAPDGDPIGYGEDT